MMSAQDRMPSQGHQARQNKTSLETALTSAQTLSRLRERCILSESYENKKKRPEQTRPLREQYHLLHKDTYRQQQQRVNGQWKTPVRIWYLESFWHLHRLQNRLL